MSYDIEAERERLIEGLIGRRKSQGHIASEPIVESLLRAYQKGQEDGQRQAVERMRVAMNVLSCDGCEQGLPLTRDAAGSYHVGERKGQPLYIPCTALPIEPSAGKNMGAPK